MSSRKKRKRDRLRTAGGDREPHVSGGKGETPPATLLADWKHDMTESCQLIREAIREGWPTERGPEILAALVDGDEPMGG